MLRTPVSSAAELLIARSQIAVELADCGHSREHIRDVEVVADELVTLALDSGISCIELFVRSSEATTRVVVRCERNLELHAEPSDLRSQILNALTSSLGTRANAFGTIDLWADIASADAALD